MGGRLERKRILSKPIKSLDLEKVKTMLELMEGFKQTSIQARNMGKCFEVYENMLLDEDRPTVILGLSGPLIAAGLRKVIRDMVQYNLVDVIVSTGAIMYQDIYQARGFKHYVGSPDMDDRVLRDHMIDRIYDTLVDEEKFEETDRIIGKMIDHLKPGNYSSREILSFLGRNIAKTDENSILYTAHRKGVPVFSPALNDSSIGIGLTLYYERHRNEERIALDSLKDNHELLHIVLKSKKTGVIYVGGGVPKNWINDAVVMANYAYGKEIEGHSFALQITTANPADGGLSGSTLEEAQSWGKIWKKATKATAYVEASVALPLLVGAVLQKKLYRGRKRISFVWEEGTVRLRYE
jgi:deoxyhypusine synthase